MAFACMLHLAAINIMVHVMQATVPCSLSLRAGEAASLPHFMSQAATRFQFGVLQQHSCEAGAYHSCQQDFTYRMSSSQVAAPLPGSVYKLPHPVYQ